MQTRKRLINIVPRLTAIVFMMLFVLGNLNPANASGPALATTCEKGDPRYAIIEAM